MASHAEDPGSIPGGGGGGKKKKFSVAVYSDGSFIWHRPEKNVTAKYTVYKTITSLIEKRLSIKYDNY